MAISALTHSSLLTSPNVEVKTPLWKRIALLVAAVAATIFSLGFLLGSNRVLNWYKEFWTGYPVNGENKIAQTPLMVSRSVNAPVTLVKATQPSQDATLQMKSEQNAKIQAIDNCGKEALDKVDSRGYTPLLRAVSNDAPEAVKELIRRGAKIDHKNDYGDTALHLAKSVRVVEMLLAKAPKLLERKNNLGNTPLINAAWNGYLEVVEELIKRGAKANAKSVANSTALHFTSSAPVVAKLLEKAPRLINKTDATGSTPLILAARKDYLEVVRELLARGAKAHIKNKSGETALDCARGQAVKALLTKNR